LLILLGIWGRWFTGVPESATSNTALIPAGFGVALLILGLLAFKESWRKHTMHAAAALGLIGFIAACVRGVPNWPTYLSGGEVKNANATLATLLMAIICGVFVALCVCSFIVARRARKLREAA
jgi:hypothetical protein